MNFTSPEIAELFSSLLASFKHLFYLALVALELTVLARLTLNLTQSHGC